MKTIKLAVALFFCLGGLNALAAGDFDSLRGASARQALEDSLDPNDFQEPDYIPMWPAIPPSFPPDNHNPFFTDNCMMYCPFGYNYYSQEGSCTCRDPFENQEDMNSVCEYLCSDPSMPGLTCDCSGAPKEDIAPAGTSGRAKRAAQDRAGTAGFLEALLESTATIVCGGVEYSIFAFPMNCGMEPVFPAEWFTTAAAYYASETARARQPLLKEAALRYFTGTGNTAAAAAVAERGSRIFSDGTDLFVAGAGKVTKIQEKAAARRVYSETFPGTGAAKVSGDLGVHPAVVSGVLSCLASDACWTGLPLSGK
jgi:hypothetical protein